MQTESENEQFITKRKTNRPTIKNLRGPVRQCVWVRLFVYHCGRNWKRKLRSKCESLLLSEVRILQAAYNGGNLELRTGGI